MDNEKQTYQVYETSDFRDDGVFISRLATFVTIYPSQSFHTLSSHQVLLFTKGSGFHTIDFQKFAVKPYQICFLVPGQVYSHSFDDEVDGYIVEFSTSFFQSFLLPSNYMDAFSFFTGIASEAVLQIPEGHSTDLETTFEEMLKDFADNKRLKFDFIRILLLKVFILTSRFSDDAVTDGGSSYNRTLLKSFRQLIERNFMNLRLPKEYAELLYITPNHLNALCNDMTGMSAGDVIRNRVALEAKRYLINPDLAVSDIASQLKFNDNSYFSKFFKKQTGLTPEEFRKSILKS